MAPLHNSLPARAGCLRVSLAFCFERTEHRTSALQRLHDDELSVEVVSSSLRLIEVSEINMGTSPSSASTPAQAPDPLHRQSAVLTMDRGSGNDMTWFTNLKP